MSRQPPHEIAPIPPRPGASMAQPDRGARLALAGFLCGLASLIAAMLGSLSLFVLNTISAFSNGGVLVFLIPAAVPVALVGLILSYWGLHSRARRRLAMTGMALSFIALVPCGVLIVLFNSACCMQ
jgi:hypothetical protein